MGNKLTISKYFQDVLNSPLKSARWSWGSFDQRTNRIFLRIWQDGIVDINGRRWATVYDRTVRKESEPGQRERIAHLDLLRSGVEGYCVVVQKIGSTRSIKSYDGDTLYRLGEIVDDGETIQIEILNGLSVPNVLNSVPDSSVGADIVTIATQSIPETDRIAQIVCRIGQGQFRRNVLKLWGGCCAVTGVKTDAAIRASHIKPWKDSSDQERLDPWNGLPLVASLDALFDAGLITFEDDGVTLVSN